MDPCFLVLCASASSLAWRWCRNLGAVALLPRLRSPETGGATNAETSCGSCLPESKRDESDGREVQRARKRSFRPYAKEEYFSKLKQVSLRVALPCSDASLADADVFTCMRACSRCGAVCTKNV